jgi:thioesterase domain-containing protein
MTGANARSPETLTDLERILHTEIPLTRAMDVRVVRADQNGLVLGAALAPNLNHKKTAFGGSLNSLATLACWGSIQLLVRDRGQAITVVIQESSVQFLKPVTRDFEAVCPLPPAPVIERFLHMLERKGRARLALEATIRTDGEIALHFHGQFVAYDRARFPGFEPVSVV